MGTIKMNQNSQLTSALAYTSTKTIHNSLRLRSRNGALGHRITWDMD